MEVNYLLVLLAAVAQFAVGALWYSPFLFSKMWMEALEVDCSNLPPEEIKKMQKSMMPFYLLQFGLTLFTTISLANLLPYITAFSAYHVAFWIWIGFIAPVQVAGIIWGNTKKKYWLRQILIMLSNQFVSMMVAAFVLSL